MDKLNFKGILQEIEQTKKKKIQRRQKNRIVGND